MKKLSMMFVFLSFAFSAFGQEDCTYNAGDINIDVEKVFASDRDGNAVTGTICDYYENGKLKNEIFVKNGVPEGLSKTYNEGGWLEIEGNYKNGVADGLIKGYYESGKTEYEMYYTNGERESLKIYYKNGKLSTEVLRQSEGSETMTRYRENGEKWYIFSESGHGISAKCFGLDGKEVQLNHEDIAKGMEEACK